jgi:hypothetical protein
MEVHILGETSEGFITQLSKQGKEYQQICIFEPDRNLIKKAKKQFTIYGKIKYFSGAYKTRMKY